MKKQGVAVITWRLEHTDTFGDNPNFSWVNKDELKIPAKYCGSWVVRKIKEHLGWTGIDCTVMDLGSYISIKPKDRCEVVLAHIK